MTLEQQARELAARLGVAGTPGWKEELYVSILSALRQVREDALEEAAKQFDARAKIHNENAIQLLGMSDREGSVKYVGIQTGYECAAEMARALKRLPQEPQS